MMVAAVTVGALSQIQDCNSKLRKLKTGQFSHLKPVEEVVLVVIVDGEVVKVTLLLGHVFHRGLTEQKT